MHLKYYSISLLLLTACTLPGVKKHQKVAFHFEEPAQIWEATFPLGNGRIGMMPDGGIEEETIVLNEISMWSGSKQDADNPQASWYLPTIRNLLFAGRNDEAQELMYNTFVCKGQGSSLGNGANAPYGSYQLAGNLEIDFIYPVFSDKATNYRRELNLEEAVTHVSFTKGDISYQREAFTSFADDIGVIRLTADADKALDFILKMNRPEHATISTLNRDLIMTGQLPDGKDTTRQKGVNFGTRVRVILPKGGTVWASDSTLQINQATEALLLVATATDYFGEVPDSVMLAQLNRAEKKNYQTLKRDHLSGYKPFFERVSLDLGYSPRCELPMDKRLQAFAADGDDPALAALYFQFGRYLLISSTREGLLPPNLQGLWCNTIETPWNGDYHLNINLQMNHWPAEVTNLPELHRPLIEWTRQQVQSGEKTAKAFYNSRGWVTHILGNVWEFTAPGEHPSWGATNTSAAWLCEHLYHHYLFAPDTAYLAQVYPVMKGAALFFTDMLVEDPRSKYLVTAPTTSPENAYRTPDGKVVYVSAGSTMDNQIVRELFNNTIEAAGILGLDSVFARTLADKRNRLMPTTIAEDGRIMEWLEPYEEVEPHHRHVSHLYGLYPGDEISMSVTPELAEAARQSLLARGDQSTGWSMAWKINFWARLHDGDHAYKLLTDLLQPCIAPGETKAKGGGTYPNLFCSHPPFQIDGNLGGTAGIAEMLLQSQTGDIEWLPALPAAWPDGSYKGLRVRGGAEASAKWEGGKLTEAGLKATQDNRFSLRLPKENRSIRIVLNRQAISLPVIDGRLTVDLKAGDELQMQF